MKQAPRLQAAALSVHKSAQQGGRHGNRHWLWAAWQIWIGRMGFIAVRRGDRSGAGRGDRLGDRIMALLLWAAVAALSVFPRIGRGLAGAVRADPAQGETFDGGG